MFRIGDFSQLAQVSIRALRYYDEIGLLKPAHIDRFTDYRYYTIEQLPKLNRILALKDLGFSLDQIVNLVKDDIPIEQLEGMLLLKQAELEQQIQDEQMRLRRVASRLKQIKQEGKLSTYEIVLKKIEPLMIVSKRAIVPTISDADMKLYRCSMLGDIYRWLEEQQREGGQELFLYHMREYVEQDIDIEAAVVLNKATSSSHKTARLERVMLQELPAIPQAASVVHQGSLYDLPQAFVALFTWIANNEYSIAGPCRELHLFWSELDKQVNFDDVVIEMQMPIEKQ